MNKKIQDYLPLYIGQKTRKGGRITFALLAAAEEAAFDAYSDIVPLLSKLEDVTDEQWAEIENEMDIFPEARGVNMIRDNFMDDRPDQRCGWDIINQTLIQLRKRGVDVDGLIESGLAIDKSTLK